MKDDPKAPVTFTPTGDATFTPTNDATFTPVADEPNKSPLTTAQQRLQKIAERMGDDVARKVEKSVAWYLNRLKGTAERATGGASPAKAFANEAASSGTPPKQKPSDEPPLESASVPAKPKPPVMTPGAAAMAGTTEPLREANAGGVHIEPGEGMKSLSWAGKAAIGFTNWQRGLAARGVDAPSELSVVSPLLKTFSAMVGDKQSFGANLADRLRLGSKDYSASMAPATASGSAGVIGTPKDAAAVGRSSAPTRFPPGSDPEIASLTRAVANLVTELREFVRDKKDDDDDPTESADNRKSMWEPSEQAAGENNQIVTILERIERLLDRGRETYFGPVRPQLKDE